MLSALCNASESLQTFWGCDETDTGGVLGVLVDGAQYSGDTLASGNDYTGVVTATELLAGTHTWQLTLDGTPQSDATGEFTTIPVAGNNMKIVVIADVGANSSGYNTIYEKESDAACGVVNGDVAYINVEPGYASTECAAEGNLPVGADPVVLADTLAIYRCRWRYFLSAAFKRARNNVLFPWFYMWNNHEMGTDPWGESNAPQVGVKFQAAFQAAWEYTLQGNPSGATGYDTYPSPILYYDKIIGDCHFIVPDMLSYGFTQNNVLTGQFEGSVPDGAGGSNTGDKQVDWIVDTINASTSKFIVLMASCEPPAPAQEPNVDAQWATIYNAIDAKDATIILVTAHTHSPSAKLIGEPSGALYCTTRNLLNVQGTPFDHPLRSTFANDWENSGDALAYFYDLTEDADFTPSDPTVNRCYMTLDSNPQGTADHPYSHLGIKIKNAITGHVRWECVIREGERVPIIPDSTPMSSGATSGI